MQNLDDIKLKRVYISFTEQFFPRGNSLQFSHRGKTIYFSHFTFIFTLEWNVKSCFVKLI